MHASTRGGPHVAVVGGGVSGLVAARELARGGATVTLVERDTTLGGRVRGAKLEGATFDVGAEAFATRGGAVAALMADLGLSDRIVHPAQLGSWVVTANGALPLPPGGAVGIPARPLAAAVRAHLGLRGALRVAVEPLLRRDVAGAGASAGGTAETLGALVRRRLGDRALDRLVRPIALGVYSTVPDRLEVQAVPGLADAYARTGSLVRAARQLRDASVAAGGAVAALAGGMTALVDALASDAEDRGSAIRTGTRVVEITRGVSEHAAAPGRPSGAQWTLRDGAGKTILRCDAVLLAVPESVAAALLAERTPPPPEHDIEVVALAVAEPRLDAAPRGTGALVAEGAGIAAKALTHATAKWPDRAASVPAGTHVIRLSYGRAGAAPETAGLSDDEALALACRDASLILGVPIAPAAVREWTRQPWKVGAPPGSAPRLAPPPGVELAGDWVSGTGLASVVPGARAAAARLLEHLTPTNESSVPSA
ncbi:oxygen-dependent protoporphyrinogen oxidase [Leucobacter komagatae]|uniref:Oxygen-dependent protoporphyrinogen oxidase n=1 Tax=Leucobacter komagatae TaxID=55969 RepID=A0A542Y909_9MICO|nr:FAD-dependent oxidoreductase [Leucobacter komagatae]TQL44561.1 oxygen-dependent protoporphyrinogen oxidase [Leucobacter komagatae]